MFQDMALEELRDRQRKQDVVWIDVRSPAEYANATIPGSVNIPFFDDAERAEIGTLYSQVSVQAAKERGLEIISAKLPAFIKAFGQIDAPKAVFCWRGGMRSKTTATLLSLMDIRVYRLIGGYRAYRRWVVETLESLNFPPRMVVVHGYTGAGKTALLRRLRERGHPVLDLEAMAGHRGSVFGQIGLNENNQKTFDALLLEELLRLRHSPYVVLEAESRRIGKVVIPEFLMRKKEQGIHVWLDVPVPARVELILQEYRPWEHKERCLQAFQRIRSRIHTPVASAIEASLRDDAYAEGVKLLLQYYYDPRYDHSSYPDQDPQGIRLSVQSPEEACEALEACLNRRTFGVPSRAGAAVE